jgi:DNA polymerase-3 subunit gamma/tau
VIFTPQNYQVLARKYRPQSFKHLVGQDALIRTLSNAIKMNRLANAFLLTGIRGVGKTTTARIIAKSINCIGLDKNQDIIEHCGKCNNCLAFAENSHPDIIEMDAASRTGINDVREIIENANYLPLLGKFKIYIIDEIHMLSNSAFNALLKTLEEPPAHVKFIFATTELKKIPITVLSRCQKFDLKRLPNSKLIIHLSNIATSEKIAINEEALSIIAANSEGSVRDSLSLLDQAIANNFGNNDVAINAEIIRSMLGISNKTKIYQLLELITNCEIKEALKFLSEMYEDGADPSLIIESLLESVHFINKIKVIPELINDSSLAESERNQASVIANKLDVVELTTIWQILLKSLQEIRISPRPIDAAEMTLIRLCYSSGIASPIDLINDLKKKLKSQ